MVDKSEVSGRVSDVLRQEASRKPVFWVVLILVSNLTGGAVGVALGDLAYGVVVATVCLPCLLILTPARRWKDHSLIADDTHGFVGNLKLSDKTAILDGSNIYHFGLHNGVGATALRAIVHELRSDGFRIVSFFDANIYFTMKENGDVQATRRFSPEILEQVFGLNWNEIYVVPSGVQADKYVLEMLDVLPKAFAVTNDRYRDYEPQYAFLEKDQNWRKGVKIMDGRLMLYRYNFRQPVMV